MYSTRTSFWLTHIALNSQRVYCSVTQTYERRAQGKTYMLRRLMKIYDYSKEKSSKAQELLAKRLKPKQDEAASTDKKATRNNERKRVKKKDSLETRIAQATARLKARHFQPFPFGLRKLTSHGYKMDHMIETLIERESHKLHANGFSAEAFGKGLKRLS